MERNRFFSFLNNDDPFFMDICGYIECPPAYLLDKIYKKTISFEYIIKGEGTLVIDNKLTYNLKKGDVVILPSNKHIYYTVNKENPVVKYFFNPMGILTTSLINSYIPENKYIIHCPEAENHFKEFTDTALLCIPQDETFLKCSLIFHNILITLYNKNKSENIIPKDILVLKAYLENNISENITLKDMSDFLHCSNDHTIKLFKKYFKKTPYSYFFELKIKTAKTMLLNTNLSIAEISNKLGFYDQHYFSNCFKKIYGKSPSIYKQEYAKMTDSEIFPLNERFL